MLCARQFGDNIFTEMLSVCVFFFISAATALNILYTKNWIPKIALFLATKYHTRVSSQTTCSFFFATCYTIPLECEAIQEVCDAIHMACNSGNLLLSITVTSLEKKKKKNFQNRKPLYLASLRDCFLLRLYALEFRAVSKVVSLLVHATTSALN